MIGKFRTRDLFEAAYLSLMSGQLPECEGTDRIVFAFDDPEGEIAWLWESYRQDESAKSYLASIKRLKNLLSEHRKENGFTRTER